MLELLEIAGNLWSRRRSTGGHSDALLARLGEAIRGGFRGVFWGIGRWDEGLTEAEKPGGQDRGYGPGAGFR
jgi:hypothetical protein